MCKFSVVIPLYNKEAYIGRALQSVLSQTISDIEIIVVDDGSTDNSIDVVESFGDPRIVIVSQENTGVSSARNKGISQANSELIAFLDADDEWEATFLEIIDDLCQSYPRAAMYATNYWFSVSGHRDLAFDSMFFTSVKVLLTTEEYLDMLGHNNLVTSSSVVVRRQAIKEAGGFRVEYAVSEDTSMWFRLALEHATAFSSEPSVIYYVDIPGSTVNRKLVVGDYPFANILDEYLANHETSLTIREKAWDYINRLRLYHTIFSTWLSGDEQFARYILSRVPFKWSYSRRWLLLHLLMIIKRSTYLFLSHSARTMLSDYQIQYVRRDGQKNHHH